MYLYSGPNGDINFPGLTPEGIEGMSVDANARLGAFVYNVDAQAATILLTAADLSGASDEVFLGLTGAITTAQNAQLPTVAALVAELPNPTPGQSWKIRVINVNGSSSGVFTLTTNTGWTLHGSMAIAITSWRDFLLTLTSATAAVLQDLGGNNTTI